MSDLNGHTTFLTYQPPSHVGLVMRVTMEAEAKAKYNQDH